MTAAHHSSTTTSPCAFLETMSLSSQKDTNDSHTPSASSSRSPLNRVLRHRSSKETIIQSPQGSISNFSVHSPPAAIYKDLGFSVQGSLIPLPPVSNHSSDLSSSGQEPSISDHKSSHSLEKRTFGFRNQSLSTVCTTRDDESDCNSIATSTPRQRFRSLSLASLEDEANSSLPPSPDSFRATAPTLITDPSPSPSPVDAVPPSPPLDDLVMESFLPPRMGTTPEPRFRRGIPKDKKGILGFMTGFLNPNKRQDTGTRPDVSKSVDDSFVPTVSAFLCRFPQLSQTVQSSWRCCLRKILTHPATVTTPRVLPHLTCRHRIPLHHLRPGLRSLISTGRTPGD